MIGRFTVGSCSTSPLKVGRRIRVNEAWRVRVVSRAYTLSATGRRT